MAETPGTEPSPGAGSGPPARTLAGGVSALGLVAWPLLVWGTLRIGDPRTAAGVMLVAVVVVGALALRSRGGPRLGAMVPAAVLSLLALLSRNERFLFIQPVLVNLAIAFAFGWSLRPGATPLCEVFARRLGDLPPGGPAHCRTFTRIWFGFAALNSAVAAWLAARATPEAWALWTGPGSYAAIAALLAGEFAIRRMRFGRPPG